MWKELFKFNSTDRAWHLPVLAGLCVGLPLLIGFQFDDMEAGKLASIGALVILHIQSNQIINRMMILMTCGFAFIFSFAIGVIFSFNIWATPIVLGLYSFGVHFALNKLSLNKAPGNFFMIMVCAIALCLPHDVSKIGGLIGSFTMGVLIACTLGLFYSLLVLRRQSNATEIHVVRKNSYVNITESIIYGTMVGLSMVIAILLELENPYWVPTSCLAVMQGINTKHVWTRAAQRVLGTFVGLGLAWLVLTFDITVVGICISILVLQIIVEFLVVRNYAIAAVFISMLTVLLVEPNIHLIENPNVLIQTRFIDILLGSIIGAIGGWMLYHQRIHFFTKKQMKKTKLVLTHYKR